VLIAALLTLSLFGGAPAQDGVPWLKVDGRRIVTDPGNQAVLLRGANIMGSEWDGDMAWERRAFPMLAHDWNGNVMVRGFAADPVNAGDATYLSWLDEYVALAEANRIYVVFVFRSYGLNGEQPRFPGRRATRALSFLAARYRDRSNVMYGLQVEPHDVRWTRLRPRFERMVDAIRAAAAPQVPLIMVPGVSWGLDLSPAIRRPIRRPNVVYKTSAYVPASHFRRNFGRAHAAGLPVFVGEFGDAPALGMTMPDVVALLRHAREHGIGWAAWIFDSKGGPELLASRDGTPTVPYGATVKEEMSTTPPVPPAGRVTSAPGACSRPQPARSRPATCARRARSGHRCR
jgi:hypothetical protein